jgi:hypothetical protein
METVAIKSIVAEVLIHGTYQPVYEADILTSNLNRFNRADTIDSEQESTPTYHQILQRSHKSVLQEIINDSPALLNVSSLTEPICSGLKTFIDSNLQTLKRTFRALLILISIVTMLNLASYFTIYSIIKKETKFYYETSYLTKDMFKLRMISDQYSILSKQIYLVDSGVDILKNKTQIQTSLLEYADQVLIILQNIKDTDLDENFIELLYKNQHPWWSYNEGTCSVTYNNILDTMYRMVTLGRDLASQQNITHTTQSFMEIYRNCPSETRKAFIELTLQSIQNHIVWYDTLENNLEYTIGMVCLLLSLINSGAIVYLFYRISLVRKNFWKRIRSIPMHFISDLLIIASPGHQGHRKKHEVSHAAGYSNLIHQKCLYIFGALFCLVIPGVVLYISYSLVPMGISYLKNSFEYINAAGFQRSMMKNSYFLLRENYTPLDILHSNTYFSYTPGEVIESLDALKELQQEAFEARYLSASIEEAFLNIVNDKNRIGLYYAMNDYRFMVFDCLEYLKTDWKIGNQKSLEIDKVTDELVNQIGELIVMIGEELMRRLDECLDRQLRELVGISFGVVGFVFGVMIPITLKIRKMLKAETKCLIYLPK